LRLEISKNTLVLWCCLFSTDVMGLSRE
jgi:hypothetical protein